MTKSVEDPFEHLHNENYHITYEHPKAGYDTMIHSFARKEISLNGTWYCTLDPFDEGLRQKWFAENKDNPKAWRTPRDYEVEAGKQVVVPGCMNLYDPHWLYYEGAMWLTRDFKYEPKANERVFLRVGAAAYQAKIFLNGRFLATHLGASTPFFIELTNLEAGENRLQIQTDNTRKATHVPMHHIDWFNYGGIYREVSLVILPTVFIADFGIALAPRSDKRTIRVDITLSDPVDGTAQIDIPELNVKDNINILKGYGQIEFLANPELWSPTTPRLYSVNVQFNEDSINDRVGFRDIHVDGENILLNGSPIWLRGICVHEEFPEQGKASSEQHIRQMLQDVLDLGCNFIRLAHYPHHELVARIADEMGLLLWQEIPVYWAIDFTSQATFSDAENQLRELIRRDRNRASVIVWGVGNENEDSDARYQFMSHLARTAREADQTRLVSAACLINREKFMIEDRLSTHLDIVGINEYFGWYEPDFKGLTRLIENSYPGKPVIITETGADAVAGLRGGKRELFTEDCQAEIYREQIERIKLSSYIKGFCPWILYDFRSERRQTRFQNGYNRKGLIAEDHKTRKMAFSVLHDFYKRVGSKV